MEQTKPSLRVQAVHGVKWTGISTIITTALLYGRLAVLAHLLPPEDFGLMGMVLVIINLGMAFADLGISQAIIWKQEVTSDQLSTLYWINIIAGIIVFGVVLAISPFVSAFFHEPRLVGLMFWAAFIFPIMSFGQQFFMLLQKDLCFKRIAVVEISAASVGVAVAITAAVLDQGVLSLIWGQLSHCLVASLCYGITGWHEWRPRFVFKPRELKGIISFGLFQMGQRVVNDFAVNVDYIMVGRFLGPELLGIYMLAWQIMVAPMTKINPVLTKVAFPVFAKKQTDDSALCRGYIELSKIIAILTLPILVLVTVTAPVLIPVIFGPQWVKAVPLVQIFSLLGLFRSLSNPIWSMLWAKGLANVAFVLNSILAVVSAGVFWFAAQRGLYTMAWTEVIIAGLFFLIVIKTLNIVIGLKYWNFIKDVGRPSLLALAGGAVTFGFYLIFKEAGNDVVLLAGLLCIGVLCYVVLIGFFERKYFISYFQLLIGNRRKAEQ